MRATGMTRSTGFAPCAKRRDAVPVGLQADRVDRAVAGAEAAAGPPHRARSSRPGRPPIQTAARRGRRAAATSDGDQRAPADISARERDDAAPRRSRDRSRPGGVLGTPSRRAAQVALELVPADAAARAGTRGRGRRRRSSRGRARSSAPRRCSGAIGIQRAPRARRRRRRASATDVDEVDAGLAGPPLLGRRRDVSRDAAGVDLRVLERDAAEGDDQLRVLGDLVPRRADESSAADGRR